jgi:hypothetical protein
MIREIIKPKSEEYLLHIPKGYINKKIEILIIPFKNVTDSLSGKSNYSDALKKTAGILKNKNIDPVVWQKNIRAEW